MNVLGTIFLAVVLSLTFGLLLSLPVMWLWNWLMPTIFGLPTLTWPQSLGLLVLAGCLFKTNVVTR